MGNQPKRVFRKKETADFNAGLFREGILKGDRAILAKAITLVESHSAHHAEMAQILLQQLSDIESDSIRIGISGVPGAGKSTFIEALGSFLCSKGHKVAVLAVDPSSNLSGGSILGDKTRMEELSRNPRAFIRPSPTGGTLGGVHRKTRETITLCEAAGYDVILVETVGVGQSEAAVRQMVDFFLLLVLTGAGDELQGMKKGIMELTDAILVNKADGANLGPARKTMGEYNGILHFIQPATKGWTTKAYTCSAATGQGIKEFWEVIQTFQRTAKDSGVFDGRRQEQLKDWMQALITDRLHSLFYQSEAVHGRLSSFQNDVLAGQKTAPLAVEELFAAFIAGIK
ncbi:methylmalonyl Co-A mutase-associated GTPase MeaB [Peribacillus kribbensis]|uniref:methylmalonyl Co-A mutase-associated GTPase MeaB n=1 Tax=Peribacillus kribbensis TaxID=356658 RepID=UPI000407C711|nr:methylmalonyl Co-A mutase-associated GTPase MeaB [Peribacillus kribbensis]